MSCRITQHDSTHQYPQGSSFCVIWMGGMTHIMLMLCPVMFTSVTWFLLQWKYYTTYHYIITRRNWKFQKTTRGESSCYSHVTGMSHRHVLIEQALFVTIPYIHSLSTWHMMYHIAESNITSISSHLISCYHTMIGCTCCCSTTTISWIYGTRKN